MNWGKGIILSFVVFVGVIFTMVYISVNTEFSLVAKNYYEQEIDFEDQLDRIRNFNALDKQPEFNFDRSKQLISLGFDEEIATAIQEGKVKFFRASNARYDKEYTLELDEANSFTIDSKTLLTGAWTIQLLWSDGAKEYYKEIKFVI